jgi:hypothetical protein
VLLVPSPFPHPGRRWVHNILLYYDIRTLGSLQSTTDPFSVQLGRQLSLHVSFVVTMFASIHIRKAKFFAPSFRPLEDEPASIPAINAALKEKNLPTWSGQNQTNRGRRRGNPRGTSYDANSEGRQTFYTSANGPESTGTSFSVAPRPNHHQRNHAHPTIPQLPRLRTAALVHESLRLSEEPTSGDTWILGGL